MDAVDWLLAGDPAVRWQTLRDLTDATDEHVQSKRVRVAGEGWGFSLLAEQGADGLWHRAGEAPWVPNLYAMANLRLLGIDPADRHVQRAVRDFAAAFRWDAEFGGLPFSGGEEEACINGRALAASSYFGAPEPSLAARLLAGQLSDGRWNCDAPDGSRGLFNSTICVREGLLAYERTVGADPAVARARERGEEYLLKRNLFRRASDREIADLAFLRVAPRIGWHYDVLRGLDYFRDVGRRDERLAEAVELVRVKRDARGRWLLDRAGEYDAEVTTGETIGAPSRWATLSAVRVLDWWDGGDAPRSRRWEYR